MLRPSLAPIIKALDFVANTLSYHGKPRNGLVALFKNKFEAPLKRSYVDSLFGIGGGLVWKWMLD